MKQLIEDIKTGSFRHVYLLYGKEHYLRNQYRDRLVKALLPEDSGMNLCGATDLPLMIPNVPESIYYSAGGHLEGGEIFNRQNTLTAAEILKAWTIGGAYDLGMEDRIGTLEAGKYADIAVFDRDLTAPTQPQSREANVVMTILNGQIVYKA